jgi:oxygen-independent coproporphyrinogen III oxidase
MNTRLTTEELLRRYGGAVPRYTSYPTAVQFKKDFTPKIGDVPPGTEVSIYLHIPFCRSLCSYCGCLTRVVHDDSPINNYLAVLDEEIGLLGSMTGYSLTAGHIHFGGGSPNLLSGEDIESLINLIDLNFDIRDGAEIAIEADPRQMTAEKARGYALAGVNRVSLGVQDFQRETQLAINRIQPFSQVEACVGWLKDAGIGNINFDLMYGLPCQTEETIADNVQKAVTLNPSRISVFGYAHVPWMRPHQKILEKYTMPGPLERYRQAQVAREAFLNSGYLGIGMDHFALPGDSLAVAAANRELRRNFQGYTTDRAKTLIGLGISSISCLPGAFMQNTTSFKDYKEKLSQGDLPVEKGAYLTPEDVMRADLIEQLMCYFTADTADACRRHGFSEAYLAEDVTSLCEMERDGIVELDGSVVTITESGRPFVRSVCAAFDSYFEGAQNRHARAV